LKDQIKKFIEIFIFLMMLQSQLPHCSAVVDITTMQLASVIAASFISALTEGCYPTKDIEPLFGIGMGTAQGQLMLGTWSTLFKADGCVNASALSRALCTDTLPEAFKTWVHQSQGSGYTEELLARGLEDVLWMRLVEFKFRH
jgi:hypothetical protein